MEHASMITVILLFCLLLILSGKTRKPAVSGRWYSADKDQLQNEIKTCLEDVELDSSLSTQEPLGIMVPHAGYMFSAPVAAYGYKFLENKSYNTVIFIGSSHHYYKGIISIYDGDSLSTPLGNIPIDKELTKHLLAADNAIQFSEDIHIPEHSNEAQFPFVQYMLKEFKAVSILTSSENEALLQKTADALFEYISKSDEKFLFVISSDMSHFHRYETATKMDKHTLDLIEEENWDKLRTLTKNRSCELCGWQALDIFSRIYKKLGSGKPQVLRYANSGDAHPEYGLDEVVGYGAVLFSKVETRQNTKGQLSEETRNWLLKLARSTIGTHLNKLEFMPNTPQDDVINEDRAVFVTLHKNGQLRGCIGHMQPRMSLKNAVPEMAHAAAFEDPRFPPLTAKELDNIKIEISVLTPMKRITSLNDIVMGRDGVMVRQGFHSGVFLPQVARETGWDKETFLSQLCSGKAFLPPDAYLDPKTEIYIFQVEEFEE